MLKFGGAGKVGNDGNDGKVQGLVLPFVCVVVGDEQPAKTTLESNNNTTAMKKPGVEIMMFFNGLGICFLCGGG